MKFLESITAALKSLGRATPATAENAAVFFYGRSPSKEEIQALASDAKITIVPDWGKTRITLEWPQVRVMVTIDANWKSSEQVPGMRNWVHQIADDKPAEAVKKLHAEMAATSNCYGCAITPGFDAEGRALAFLLALLGQNGGFYFYRQSFYDARGQRVIGAAGDPETLGAKTP